MFKCKVSNIICSKIFLPSIRNYALLLPKGFSPSGNGFRLSALRFNVTVKRCLIILLAISVFTIISYTRRMDSSLSRLMVSHRKTYLEPSIHCSHKANRSAFLEISEHLHNHKPRSRLRFDPKVLVLVETAFSTLSRDLAELLVYNKIKYRVEVMGKSLPVLTNYDKGKFSVIVFENLNKYLLMDKWNRELLDKYCWEYGVGIVAFVPQPEQRLASQMIKGFPLFVTSHARLMDATLNGASAILRLTRAGDTVWGTLPDEWVVFHSNHSTYEPISWALNNTADDDYPTNYSSQPLATVIQDRGSYDGIRRVFFGSGLQFWLNRLLFLDSLSYLSQGQLSFSLERRILIDIDDIFVGESGTRLKPDDVLALINTQERIRQLVPGFRFNLGYSGKYFHHGNYEENLGDDLLLAHVGKFTWFSHMWNHQQPHLYTNQSILEADMMLNAQFAKDHGIPLNGSYSVAPHHSGVYPVHELLYSAWKKIWNVKVTSTEEYPHLRPARLRRGFIHRGIMVLPRQTCGLFTHTIFIERYPGGRAKLDESIQGGELFQTIVYNPINVFMSHMSNYGNDRLALYTFESAIKFINCWTNLRIVSSPPLIMAQKYFRMFPEEIHPVWGNPCDDPRHLKIWIRRTCEQLPRFLVIGPQKTGTTALYSFLAAHPNISSNLPSSETFEEIQFFNGKNYFKGLDWYANFFPFFDNETAQPQYLFEKSATYFDGEAVPRRAHALLPSAKLITILISPAKRAYSWYQHAKSHGDAVATKYSFYDVISANETAPKRIRDLRNRCLNPGKYAQHLERWLSFYVAQQLCIVDGDQLRSNPITVMDQVQKFLKVTPLVDYSNLLRYDYKKGFFCQIVDGNHIKCLGKNKGRSYDQMDSKSYKFLQKYYVTHNTALVKLLKRLGYRDVPQWLKNDLSDAVPL